jgi:hypothetical protein
MAVGRLPRMWLYASCSGRSASGTRHWQRPGHRRTASPCRAFAPRLNRAFGPRLKLGRRWSRWRPDQLITAQPPVGPATRQSRPTRNEHSASKMTAAIVARFTQRCPTPYSAFLHHDGTIDVIVNNAGPRDATCIRHRRRDHGADRSPRLAQCWSRAACKVFALTAGACPAC